MTYSCVAHADNQRSFNDGYHVQVTSATHPNVSSADTSIRSSHAKRSQVRSHILANNRARKVRHVDKGWTICISYLVVASQHAFVMSCQ